MAGEGRSDALPYRTSHSGMNVRIALRISAVILLILLAAFFWGRWKYHKVLAKYPLGITIEQAQLKMTHSHPVEESGVVFPPPRPNEEDKAETTFYTINVYDEGIILDFNYHRKLFRTWKMSDPITRWLSGIGGHRG